MTKSKAKKANEPTTVVANDPEDRKGALKMIGGSQSDHWNNTLANQAVQALWVKNSDAQDRDRQLSATVAGLAGIGPKDELEGKMAAQLIAAHNAAMECYRRAMIGEQTFEGTYVDFVRDGTAGNGAARAGNARWRRLTEERAGGAKSVFHFDVQGQVAKSTHAGIPWLRFIRREVGDRVHFWPFDGWDIPASRSAIAEVYPALWSRGFAREDRTGDQQDAFSIAAWLWRADRDGSLAAFLNPDLSPAERAVAQVEGWILGVPGLIRSGEGRDASATPNACAPNLFRLH